MKVLIDSGGWLSVIIESDQYHEAGRSYFEALMALGSALETFDFVLDEVITRLRYDVGHGEAVEFLGLIRDFPIFLLPWPRRRAAGYAGLCFSCWDGPGKPGSCGRSNPEQGEACRQVA